MKILVKRIRFDAETAILLPGDVTPKALASVIVHDLTLGEATTDYTIERITQALEMAHHQECTHG